MVGRLVGQAAQGGRRRVGEAPPSAAKPARAASPATIAGIAGSDSRPAREPVAALPASASAAPRSTGPPSVLAPPAGWPLALPDHCWGCAWRWGGLGQHDARSASIGGALLLPVPPAVPSGPATLHQAAGVAGPGPASRSRPPNAPRTWPWAAQLPSPGAGLVPMPATSWCRAAGGSRGPADAPGLCFRARRRAASARPAFGSGRTFVARSSLVCAPKLLLLPTAPVPVQE